MDTVGSTNDLAFEFGSDSGNDGLVIVADEQTAGRGRAGRQWQASRGSAILASVLLFPPTELAKPHVLTPLAAVAVADTIRECAEVAPAIKWPNDVLVGSKKVCGILVENRHAVVIGIGLNVNATADEFRRLGLPDAGSLRMAVGAELDRSEVLKSLLRRLDQWYDGVLSGRLDLLERAWCDYLDLVGCAAKVEMPAGSHRGRIASLSLEQVVLETPPSESISLPTASIVRITASRSGNW